VTSQPTHLYDRARTLWGDGAQWMMLTEECGELVAAVSKYHRGRIGKIELAAEREACRELGYRPAVALRDLRHTFGTLAVRNTGDPWAALQALGHSDLRTTSIYQSTTVERAAATSVAVGKTLAEWGTRVGTA